jgi:hypothetical protein
MALHAYRHTLQYHAEHWLSSIESQSIHSLTLVGGGEGGGEESRLLFTNKYGHIML